MLASGFSQNTTLPARAAAIAISACESPGVLMSTRSMSLRATTSSQSVDGFFPAELAGRRLDFRCVRPQITFIRGVSRGEKNGVTCR